MLEMVKVAVKSVAPAWCLRAYRNRKVSRLREQNELLSTKEVFTRIYRDNRWSASSSGEFRSGSGSTELIAAAHAEFVNKFIDDRSVRSIVDLGCGDFNVGRRIVGRGRRYIGVDIVEGLISHHNDEFGKQGVEFRCLNIVTDELPDGELCLIRQVFQHLSNEQIQSILPKLGRYRYVLISEHHPASDIGVVPNLDKSHGEDTRLFENSGVYLDSPPFSLENVCEVFSVEAPPIVNRGERIKTFLIENGV